MDMFPGLNDAQVQQGVDVYSSVPDTTATEQCVLVMSECKSSYIPSLGPLLIRIH
jgi:hypothetical protein